MVIFLNSSHMRRDAKIREFFVLSFSLSQISRNKHNIWVYSFLRMNLRKSNSMNLKKFKGKVCVIYFKGLEVKVKIFEVKINKRFD